MGYAMKEMNMSVVVELKKLLSFTQKKLSEIISKEEYAPLFEHEAETSVAIEKEVAEDKDEEVVEAVSPPEPKATKPSEKRGFNKSQAIREYFNEHPEATNKEVVENLREQHGSEVSAAFVSTVKFHMKDRKAPGRSKDGLNKSKVVREFLEKNSEASVKDVMSHLKEKYGTSVTPALIYSIKRSAGSKKGRKKISLKKEKDLERGDPMRACVTEVLSKFRQGVNLNYVVKSIQKSGKYHYAGSKGEKGFMATVYQALYDLSQKKTHPGWRGAVPVVLHDRERRRWKLNPKAKREIAA
jgi:hypothetical protein